MSDRTATRIGEGSARTRRGTGSPRARRRSAAARSRGQASTRPPSGSMTTRRWASRPGTPAGTTSHRAAAAAPRGTGGRGRPLVDQVGALPGDQDAAGRDAAATPARRAPRARRPPAAVTAGHARGLGVARERLGPARWRRRDRSQADGLDDGRAGTRTFLATESTSSARVAPSATASGSPGNPPPDPMSRSRSTPAPAQDAGAAEAVEDVDRRDRSGSRIAVRLIASVQASRKRTWASIASRCAAASSEPMSVEAVVEHAV